MATKKTPAEKPAPNTLFDLAAEEGAALDRLNAIAQIIEDAEGVVTPETEAELDAALDAALAAELKVSEKLDATGFAWARKKEEEGIFQARVDSAQRLVDSLRAKRNAAEGARRWIERRLKTFFEATDRERVKGDFWTVSLQNNGGALPVSIPALEDAPVVSAPFVEYDSGVPEAYVRTVRILDQRAIDALVQDLKDQIEADLPDQDQRWKDAGFKAAERKKLASAYRDTELQKRAPDWLVVGERTTRIAIR